MGRPAFVVGLDEGSGAVTVGPEEALGSSGAVLGADVVFSEGIEPPFEAVVQVRARHGGTLATVTPIETAEGPRLVARFREPVRAVSPGQVAVAYQGTRVVGGGTIVRAVPHEAKARQHAATLDQ